MGQGCVPIPALFTRHLGQKNRPPALFGQNHAVPANDYVLRPIDRNQGGQRGNLDMDILQFRACYRRKTRVGHRGAAAIVGHGLDQGFDSFDVPDTAAQPTFPGQGDKNAPVVGQAPLDIDSGPCSHRGRIRRRPAQGRGLHRVPGHLVQKQLFFLIETPAGAGVSGHVRNFRRGTRGRSRCRSGWKHS